MKRRVLLTLLFASFSFASHSHAQDYSNEYDSAYEDEVGYDYDALLKKLSQSETPYTGDPFDNVRIHLGIGLANSVSNIKHPNGDRTYIAQRGLEVGIGIDLFSRYWLAEGTIRNYGESEFENATISQKEFDMKLIYHTAFAPGWRIRGGGGIAARYLDVKYHGEGKYEQEYQTPATVLQVGIHSYLSPHFSFGADLATRNAMIDDTPDKTAYDMTIRLDGHF